MRIIRASAHTIMAWKNGLGRTDEILVRPDGASLADFDARISMAHLNADGPFSEFPGIDRTLTVLAGGPMILDFGGTDRVMLAPDDPPFAFAGDRPAYAAIDRPLVDLNIMTRRGVFHHSVVRLGPGRHDISPPPRGERMVFVTAPSTLASGSAREDLAPHDLAILDGTDKVRLATPDGSALIIDLWPA